MTETSPMEGSAGTIVEVDDESYESTVANEPLVLLYYRADWCGPCHALDPVLVELAEAYPDLTIAELDTDENEAALQEYGVESVPTMILFDEGEPVEVFVGKVPFPKLDTGVGKYA